MLSGQAAERMSPLETFRDGEVSTALERLEGSPLVAAGKVNLLALDIIRDRLGERWPGKCEQVHEHVVKSLSRHLGQNGLFFRVSATEYVVIQPQADRYAAHGSCLTYMRDLLQHFLGQAAPKDIEIREVTEIRGGGICARPIDPSLFSVPRADVRPEEPKSIPSAAEAKDRWRPFLSDDGRTLHVSTALSPAFRLNGLVQIGYRMSRRVIDTRTHEVLDEVERSRLPSSDIGRIDMTTMARAMHRIQSDLSDKAPPMLMVPASYTTLASRRGRGAMIARLREAKATLSSQLVCEIADLDGVPINALYSICSILRPFCYAIFGSVSEINPRAAGALRGAGLNGLTVRYQGPRDPTSVFAELEALISVCSPVCRTIMITDLEQAQELAVAQLAGATHASLRIAEGTSAINESDRPSGYAGVTH